MSEHTLVRISPSKLSDIHTQNGCSTALRRLHMSVNLVIDSKANRRNLGFVKLLEQDDTPTLRKR
jgi:hypothetical protein